MKRLVLEADHEVFRDTVRQFIEQELASIFRVACI